MSKTDSVQDDVQTLWRSLSVLGMTLIGLYAIFFWVEWNSLGNEQMQMMQETWTYLEAPVDTDWLAPEIPRFEENVAKWEKLAADALPEREVVTTQPPIVEIELPSADEQKAVQWEMQPWNTVQSPPAKTFFSFDELFGEELNQVIVEDVVPLSGTHQWEGVITSMELLWLTDNAKYILKDNYNTHYVYLWEFTESISSPVLLQGWNLVEIADKNDINQNVLFGDIVTFINMPDFEGVKVLLLVTFKERNDTWFLQVDHDRRYDLKKDLQAMFAKRYTR